MARAVGVAAWIFASFVVAHGQVHEQCEREHSPSKGEIYLNSKISSASTVEAHVNHSEPVESESDVPYESWRLTNKPSCVDRTTHERIPPEIDQNYQPPDSQYTCLWQQRWEISAEVLALMLENDAVPEAYYFKVCWDDRISAEERHWPWLQNQGGDFKFELTAQGSVILNPERFTEIWNNGFANVILDALDYYARMGEVSGRKIIPRFMLLGFSKGATYSWRLPRWRQDLIQAAVFLHGCNDGRRYDWETPRTKSKAYGAAPTLFYSSAKDSFSKCTYGDTTYQRRANSNRGTPKQYYEESPCDHHPEHCFPLCDYGPLYIDRFWAFMDEVLPLKPRCTEMTTEETCNELLGIWDDEDEVCDEKHPTTLTRACEKFCTKSIVDACEDMDVSNCNSSYVSNPHEQVNAKGILSSCVVSEDTCVESHVKYQCFFQDQCPPLSSSP